MRESLSPRTRALFAAARRDVPTESARAAMWSAVSAKVATVPPPPAAGPLAALKIGAVGGVIGGALVLGAALLAGAATGPLPGSAVSAAAAHTAATPNTPPAHRAPPTPLTDLASIADHAPLVGHAPLAAPAPTAPPAPLPSRAVAPSARGGAPAPAFDSLSREAAILGAARAALRSGDARAALALLESARALPERQLEPEARTLEARAHAALAR